jgi:DNA recombination protein RmuC
MITFILILQIILIALIFWLLFGKRETSDREQNQRLTEIETQLKSFQLTSAQRFDYFGEKLESFQLKMIESNSNSFLQNRQELSDTLSRVSRQLEEKFDKLMQTNDKRLEEIREKVEKSLKETLSENSKVFSDVIKNIGELKSTNDRIVEISKDINQLSEILSAPKLRGNFGEFELRNMLSQILPTQHFALQYELTAGKIVDAVIFLDNSVLCIDSKFPLENFQKALNEDDDLSTKAFLKLFAKDVRKHIDDIHSKYVIPGKTFDFAFMFIPAENIYYQILNDVELHHYALQNKIIPVSPNSLYAYLQALAIGFRNLKIQEEAERLQNVILQLAKNFGEFKRHYQVLGKHLRNAQNQYQESERDVDKFSVVISNLEGKAEGKEMGVRDDNLLD